MNSKNKTSTPRLLLGIGALSLGIYALVNQFSEKVQNTAGISNPETAILSTKDQIQLIAKEMLSIEEARGIRILSLLNEETKDMVTISRNETGKIVVKIINQDGTITEEQLKSLHRIMKLLLENMKNGKTSGKQ